MPSPIYHYVINLVMSLPIRRGPGVPMNVSVREFSAPNNYVDFCMWQICYFNAIIITTHFNIITYTYFESCTSSSAEVKERVELYLYSPSGPSWPVIGLTLPFPLPQVSVA